MFSRISEYTLTSKGHSAIGFVSVKRKRLYCYSPFVFLKMLCGNHHLESELVGAIAHPFWFLEINSATSQVFCV